MGRDPSARALLAASLIENAQTHTHTCTHKYVNIASMGVHSNAQMPYKKPTNMNIGAQHTHTHARTHINCLQL